MGRAGSVLVTGGAGYVGAHVVLALREAGWPVVVLDDLSTGRLLPLHRDCSVVLGGVGDRDLVRETLARYDVQAVVHLAASILVPESVRHPLAYYRNDVAVGLALLEACVAHGVAAFVFSSTAAVYGVPERSPVDEEAPTRPINPYGWSKLMFERVLRDAAAAHDLPFVILRYFNVAGADPELRAGPLPDGPTHLVRVALEAALGLRPFVPVFGVDYPTRDGTCVRDYVHVSDVATAHRLALDYLLGGGAGAVLNCGYSRGHTVREVVAAVERVTGRSVPTRVAPRRPGDPPEVVADARRIRDVLGWEPRWTELDAMVAHAFAWMRRGRPAEAATRRAG
ncbi:MAG: UDP-glucose 4-epimerase GalE [Geminicoccaceae bacterium]|nr:UDP-glucose 4-epimerase GalE [Geminicoccaceae bacterium]